MMRLSVIAWLACFVSSPCLSAEQPNIVFILSDDIAQGDLGCYGQKLIQTPNLDRMAAEGTRFTQAYSGTSVCAPSRSSLMTGLHMGHCPIRANREVQPEGQMPLPEGTFTVAKLLNDAGYATAVTGKWGMGMFHSPGSPLKVGFDHFFGYNCQRHAHSYFPTYLYDDAERFELEGNTGEGPGRTYAQELIERDALKWLRQNKDHPFFLFYAVTLPHGRFEIDDQGIYRDKPWTEQQKNYAAMITRLDSDVGRLLALLKELEIDEKTIVFFSGDNGSSFDPNSEIGRLFDQTMGGRLRGFKRGMYEGGLRQAALVRWPGKVPAGRVSDEPWAFWDFLPTAAELAGTTVPEGVPTDGHSLVSYLRGGSAPERDYFYWELHERASIQAVRFDNWKAVRNGPSKPIELYDLSRDVSESHDLAGAKPKLIARAEQLMTEAREDDPNWPMRDARPRANRRQAAAGPLAGMGIMIGEVTSQSALAQVRLTQTDKLVDGDVPGAAGVVEFSLRPSGNDEAAPVVQTVEATAERDFIARAAFAELEAGTQYVCTTRIGSDARSLKAGPKATFKTLPGAEAAEPVRFVVVTGMNYAKFHGDNRINRKEHLEENNRPLPPGYKGADRHLGYPALETIRKLRPLFFVGTGDNVYYDTPSKPRAQTLEEMRRKWHEQFVQPRYAELFAVVPTYWEIDDHDYRRDDGDNTGDDLPSPAMGRKMMLEQLPVAPADAADAKTYRTHRVSRDLQIWFTENRMYRSPNAMPDGPDKTIWGADQKAWLKRTLAESDATFKLLISPTPMIGPDDLRKTDNHCDIGGFQHERDEFFAWLNETGIAKKHFYLLCGDRHWQYHSISPAGLEEFSCGALIDANSRLGRKPGDPKSTDPEALIKQPYYQEPASGGFLLVEVTPARAEVPAMLDFKFHDERGKLLHEHRKQSPSE